MLKQNRLIYHFELAALLFISLIALNGCSKSDEASSINTLYEQGINNCQKGRFDEGIKYFDKILELEPHHYFSYLNRGKAYRDKTEYDSAIADFNKCIQIDPSNPEAYFELGGVWGNQGKFEEAISLYTKAIKVDANFTKAYGVRAIMKTMLGRVDLAIEDLNDAIEIDPQYPMLYIVRGQALDLKGDCQAAIVDFEKAMSFDPDNFNTSGNIAWVLATCPNNDSRNGKRALELAAQALELEAGHFNLHAMAAAYAEIGDFRKAIIYQKKAVQELKENTPPNRFEKTYREKQLKDYLNQLRSYQNNIPWHVR